MKRGDDVSFMLSTSAGSAFLKRNGLPEAYLIQAKRWFDPLLEKIKKKRHKPVFFGLNGAQGLGKSTLSDYLATCLREEKKNVVVLSIDDFYHMKAKRMALAKSIHPLLETRGVPGTHDLNLSLKVMHELKVLEGEVVVPRFDKSMDDRVNEAEWDRVELPVDVVILEGWCVGSTPQDEKELDVPVNGLEANEDADGLWRRFVNQSLEEYQALFKEVHLWVMLKAPSFACVFDWRMEQENKLRERMGGGEGLMDERELRRFLQFYQRITEHTLKTLPAKVDVVYEFDEARNVVCCKG